MRIIAFKQVKDCPNLTNSLPAEHIVEWREKDDSTVAPAWQFLPEDQFQTLISTINAEDNLKLFQQQRDQAKIDAELALIAEMNN